MLILCDFDGTITRHDVTNLIWDHYIGPQWRDELLPPYREGKISHLQIMVDGYKCIHASAGEMLDCVRDRVTLRDGFLDFVSNCRSRNWPLEVVSGGVDFYIEEFLPRGIPFHSYTGELNGVWRIFAPPNVTLGESEDFKVHVMNKLRQGHPDKPVVFIGDGRNDLPAARAADLLFVVEGSKLHVLCTEQGIACEPFDDFRSVEKSLNSSP